MSIHTQKARAAANARGGLSGHEAARPLWDLSKRELVEIALRLGGARDRDSLATGMIVVREVQALLEDEGKI